MGSEKVSVAAGWHRVHQRRPQAPLSAGVPGSARAVRELPRQEQHHPQACMLPLASFAAAAASAQQRSQGAVETEMQCAGGEREQLIGGGAEDEGRVGG